MNGGIRVRGSEKIKSKGQTKGQSTVSISLGLTLCFLHLRNFEASLAVGVEVDIGNREREPSSHPNWQRGRALVNHDYDV